MKENPHAIINLMIRMSNGETDEDLQKEIDNLGKKRAKQKGKEWGECESCSETTVLLSDIGMCGPCTWGESETYNGNW